MHLPEKLEKIKNKHVNVIFHSSMWCHCWTKCKHLQLVPRTYRRSQSCIALYQSAHLLWIYWGSKFRVTCRNNEWPLPRWLALPRSLGWVVTGSCDAYLLNSCGLVSHTQNVKIVALLHGFICLQSQVRFIFTRPVLPDTSRDYSCNLAAIVSFILLL
jgi:hypothetical protein